MKKYEIYTDRFEFRYTGGSWSAADIIDQYNRQSFLEPQIVEVCDTKEDAYKEWEFYKSYATTTVESKLLVGTIVYLAEVEMDEDGEYENIDWLEEAAEEFKDVND